MSFWFECCCTERKLTRWSSRSRLSWLLLWWLKVALICVLIIWMIWIYSLLWCHALINILIKALIELVLLVWNVRSLRIILIVRGIWIETLPVWFHLRKVIVSLMCHVILSHIRIIGIMILMMVAIVTHIWIGRWIVLKLIELPLSLKAIVELIIILFHKCLVLALILSCTCVLCLRYLQAFLLFGLNGTFFTIRWHNVGCSICTIISICNFRCEFFWLIYRHCRFFLWLRWIKCFCICLALGYECRRVAWVVCHGLWGWLCFRCRCGCLLCLLWCLLVMCCLILLKLIRLLIIALPVLIVLLWYVLHLLVILIVILLILIIVIVSWLLIVIVEFVVVMIIPVSAALTVPTLVILPATFPSAFVVSLAAIVIVPVAIIVSQVQHVIGIILLFQCRILVAEFLYPPLVHRYDTSSAT